MKTLIYSLLILTCGFLFSCNGDVDTSTTNYYYRSFFLGEDSFQMEGEIFDTNIQSNLSIPTFNSLLVMPVIYDSFSYEGWEISAIETSENKFQILFDTKANGVTITKETITNDFVRLTGVGFPSDFPMCVLSFNFSNGEDIYSGLPVNKFSADKNSEYNFYSHYYVYVAEPFNITSTRTRNESFWYITTIEHFDLDFPVPGWYKIVIMEDEIIENNPDFSSGKNTYFRLYK